MCERGSKNFILGKEAGKTRYACDGKTTYKERDLRDTHVFAKAAHFTDILLTTHCMNHAAASKKQKRFEAPYADFTMGDAKRGITVLRSVSIEMSYRARHKSHQVEKVH